MIKLAIGDSVITKKAHPCGSKSWTVTRIGADYKLSCHGCGRVVLLSLRDIERSVVEVNGEKVGR